MTNNISTKKIIIWMLVIILFGFLIGRFAFNMNDANQAVTGNENDERDLATNESVDVPRGQMVDDGEIINAEKQTMEGGENSTENTSDNTEGSSVSNQPGVYTDYDPTLLANANDGDVLLFFHASWCPSCRTLDKNINANLENIPTNVTILQLNYDTETELKKKYGVVRQHTLVHVDANGNKIKTLTGLTNSLDQVLAQI